MSVGFRRVLWFAGLAMLMQHLGVQAHAEAKYDLPAIAVPEGWTAESGRNHLILHREYPDGAVAIRISRWQSLGGAALKDWAAQHKTDRTGRFPVVSRENEVRKSGIPGALYVLRALRPQRGEQRISLLIFCEQGGLVRTVDAFGPERQFNTSPPTVFNDAAAIARTACAEPPAYVPPPRPDFQPGIAPDKLEAVWYVGEFVVGIDGYEARRWGIMTFSDGTASDDFDTVFAQGRAASMAQNANDWGDWREVDTNLEIRWTGSKTYSDYYVTLKAKPGGDDARLDGCYSSTFSSSMPLYGAGEYNTAMSVNTWCFRNNGRFSNDKAFGLSASTGDTGETRVDSTAYSGRDLSGWYRIDGHVIQMAYDNGRHLVTSIGILDNSKGERAIVLGQGHYD